MKKLFCWLGFHKDEHQSEMVFKTDFTETFNSWEKCKWCGRETEKTGWTHFGPMKFSLDVTDENK
jgi:hypothetical protein